MKLRTLLRAGGAQPAQILKLGQPLRAAAVDPLAA
jgi:hypothetical protein